VRIDAPCWTKAVLPPSSRVASHAIDERSGELRLRVDAPSIEEVFAEAGRALAALVCGEGCAPPAEGEPVPIRLRSHDRAALLVDWLNELLFRSEAERKVFTEFEFARITDRDLDAWIRGATVADLHTPVDAATTRDLKLNETAHGASAVVAFDV
jgi:SHS2 domain-containing protein